MTYRRYTRAWSAIVNPFGNAVSACAGSARRQSSVFPTVITWGERAMESDPRSLGRAYSRASVHLFDFGTQNTACQVAGHDFADFADSSVNSSLRDGGAAWRRRDATAE